LIDLHLHTTASDGYDTPADLVAQVARAGVRLFAVTDHDTVAALPVVASIAADHGLRWIPGIEITAVEHDRDVHVLGYGFDVASSSLATFLSDQRASRLERLVEFGRRFEALGLPFDVAPLLEQAQARSGRSVGRAHVARALIAAGHVGSMDEAFDKWLGSGRPGFVRRRGAPVRDVVRQIAAAGGIASLAHPGLLRDADVVSRAMESGIAALEAYHSEHDAEATRHYLELAKRGGLGVSGGSDFHGEASNRKRRIGDVSLPLDAYQDLRRRASQAGCSYGWPDAPA
jgi:predicted metal-dependent phosphoesterase TrpH